MAADMAMPPAKTGAGACRRLRALCVQLLVIG